MYDQLIRPAKSLLEELEQDIRATPKTRIDLQTIIKLAKRWSEADFPRAVLGNLKLHAQSEGFLDRLEKSELCKVASEIGVLPEVQVSKLVLKQG